MERYNPVNVNSSIKEKVRPTTTKYRISWNRLNTVSELSSSHKNKHVHGNNEYGQIFLEKGFPTFGELYPYSSYTEITQFNPATRELETTKVRKITNSANANVVRVLSGEDRRVITLVDSNFSDISNSDYLQYGKIDVENNYLSPLGLDFALTFNDRMYWEDTDDDFSVLKYNTGSRPDAEGGDATNWYVNPFFVHGNDRPYQYDTRVNMYSGTYMYQLAFDVKVFVKIYMNTPMHHSNIYSQQTIDKKYYNNGLYEIHEVELLSTFTDLEETKDQPKYGMLKYTSDVLKVRRNNPYSTDTLVLYLSEWYETGQIWDSIISEWVRVKDLDLDVIVTIGDHTSKLQPEILGIDLGAKTTDSVEGLDYLKKSQLTQYQVLQTHDPTNFGYFSKGQINIQEPAEDQEQDKMYNFPLAGGQRIEGLFPAGHNSPIGMSRLTKANALGHVDEFDIDTSSSASIVIPPPMIIYEKEKRPVSYAKRINGSDRLVFYHNYSSGVITFDDEDTFGAEDIGFLNRMATYLLFYLHQVHCSEPSTTEGVGSLYSTSATNYSGMHFQYHYNEIFSFKNPFQVQSDNMFVPTVADLNSLVRGVLPTGWGTGHEKNPYGADPEAYGGNTLRPFAYKAGATAINPVGLADCLGNANWGQTDEVEDQRGPQTGYDDLVRLSYKRWLWDCELYSTGRVIAGVSDKPSNANPTYPKQFVHPSGSGDRIFNEDTTDPEDIVEQVTYSVLNVTEHAASGDDYYTGTRDINEVILPWADIMWVYSKDASDVISIELEADKNRIKTVIDFSDAGSWGHTNIDAFVANLDDNDELKFAGPHFISPMFMRKDIKLLPDFHKIIFDLHDADYVDVVNTFLSGSWSIPSMIEDEDPISAAALMADMFDHWHSEMQIEELMHPGSGFYGYGVYYPDANNRFALFLMLWQLYLYIYYKDSIYSRISSHARIIDESRAGNGSRPYRFYLPYNGGTKYPWVNHPDEVDFDFGSTLKTHFYNTDSIEDSAFHAALSYQGEAALEFRGFIKVIPISMEGAKEMFGYFAKWENADEYRSWRRISLEEYYNSDFWEFPTQS